MFATAPRILTKADLPLPSWVDQYVLLVQHDDTVTFYIDKAHAEPSLSPAARQILRSLVNRGFPNVVQKTVTLPELKLLRAGHLAGAGTSDTVSGQRRVIDLLKQCLRAGASDAQLKQYQTTAGTRLRLHGAMTDFGTPISKSDIEQLCMTLFNMSDSSSRKGNYSPDAPAGASIVHNLAKYRLDDLFAAIRLQFNPTFLGPECDIRFQPANQTARDIETLGLSARDLTLIAEATAQREGVILVSGPVGSGKTNLLASLVKAYNLRFPGRKIQTIEDPVEISIGDQVSQWQVTGKFDARGDEYLDMLNRTLRSDAQMVMLQEMRDAAASKAFFRLGITGALAVSTIHASHPTFIIPRLSDLGVSRFNLTNPEVIRLLGGVHLVPMLCSCKIKVPLGASPIADPELAGAVDRMRHYASHAYGQRGQAAPTVGAVFIANSKGCPKCRGDENVIRTSYGTIGRTQIAELIKPDEILLNHLYEERFTPARHHLRTVLKVPSIREKAFDLIAAGIASPIDTELAIGPFPTPTGGAAE